MKQSILYIGLDVHKNSIAVALAEDGRESEIRYLGSPQNSEKIVR